MPGLFLLEATNALQLSFRLLSPERFSVRRHTIVVGGDRGPLSRVSVIRVLPSAVEIISYAMKSLKKS